MQASCMAVAENATRLARNKRHRLLRARLLKARTEKRLFEFGVMQA